MDIRDMFDPGTECRECGADLRKRLLPKHLLWHRGGQTTEVEIPVETCTTEINPRDLAAFLERNPGKDPHPKHLWATEPEDDEQSQELRVCPGVSVPPLPPPDPVEQERQARLDAAMDKIFGAP